MYNTCKFKAKVSHYRDANGNEVDGPEPFDYNNIPSSGGGNSGKWNEGTTNTLITTLGNVFGGLFDIWKPADQNTTYVVTGKEERDNTMLYIGIGGVVLVVVLFALIAFKK